MSLFVFSRQCALFAFFATPSLITQTKVLLNVTQTVGKLINNPLPDWSSCVVLPQMCEVLAGGPHRQRPDADIGRKILLFLRRS